MKWYPSCCLMFAGILVLVPLHRAAPAAQAPPHRSKVRTYYIAADEIPWDYAPSGRNDGMGRAFDDFENAYMQSGPHRIGRVYKKAVYREYTDGSFAKLKSRSADERYLGILGPVLRGEVGDTIKVFFKNNASRPFSMHPHGVLYAKDSEGAMYDDGTAAADKEDDAVPPGTTHVYVWELPDRSGPGPSDPSSVVWLYHSHVDELRDVASGLFGPIIVTARGKGRIDASPIDVDREFVTMMVTLNENESWYLDENIRVYATDPTHVNKAETIPEGPDGTYNAFIGRGFADANLRFTINGFMYGSMPMMTMKKGEHVRWYLLTIGDANNSHTPHWHGNTVVQEGHRTDTVPLSAAQMETVDMTPDNPGIWLFHCHVSDHMPAGMVTRYEVRQ